jgi:membrane protein
VDRVRRRAEVVLAQPAVAAARRVLDRYGAAGGGLLAGGLAHAALFAIVPGVLLLAGVTGLFVADPAERARVVDVLAGVLPPLRDLITAVLDEVAAEAGPVSILGAIVLIWGTSRFAVAFDDGIARVMGGSRSRGLLRRNLGALAAVALMIGAILLSTILSGVLAFLEAAATAGVIPFLGLAFSIGLGLLPVLATMLATTLVYRVVPVPSPGWRAVAAPGIVVGLALTVLARLFAYLAPQLIGAAALLGTLATAFAALAWLGLSFQALLLGAAWVRDRADRQAPSGAKPIQT